MAKIKYKGIADVRTLAAEDLKKRGVEGFKKTEFKRNEVTEVEDNVAEVLLDPKNAAIFGKFVAVEDEGTPESEPEKAPGAESPKETAKIAAKLASK